MARASRDHDEEAIRGQEVEMRNKEQLFGLGDLYINNSYFPPFFEDLCTIWDCKNQDISLTRVI